MSRKYKFHNNDNLYFISFAVVNWIDIFTREEYFNEIINSWKFCVDHKNLEIYGWCIMTNHVHMIIGSKTNKLDEIVRDMKSYTSRSLRKVIEANPHESRKDWIFWMMKRAGIKNSNNLDWQFWQQHNKPLEIINQQSLNQTLLYIHLNPVTAGFVLKPEDWKYSSAREFSDGKGLIELSYI